MVSTFSCNLFVIIYENWDRILKYFPERFFLSMPIQNSLHILWLYQYPPLTCSLNLSIQRHYIVHYIIILKYVRIQDIIYVPFGILYNHTLYIVWSMRVSKLLDPPTQAQAWVCMLMVHLPWHGFILSSTSMGDKKVLFSRIQWAKFKLKGSLSMSI